MFQAPAPSFLGFGVAGASCSSSFDQAGDWRQGTAVHQSGTAFGALRSPDMSSSLASLATAAAAPQTKKHI